MRLTTTMRGITLLEILITLTIVALVAGIAYPSYRDYTARAHRSEAIAKLLEIAANQEGFYLNANRYGSLAELGYPIPLNTKTGTYTIEVSDNDAEGFTATATYNGTGAESERCSSFTVDERRNKTSTGTLANCWTHQR